VGRTHLAITVELVSGGHAGDLWPRPGRIMIASRLTTFEQLATAIDDAFARWDRAHLHEFTLTDGTPVSPASTWDGDEREGTVDGSKARLGRLRLGEQFAYVFDLGDNWQHLCTVADGLAPDGLTDLPPILPWWGPRPWRARTAPTDPAGDGIHYRDLIT
jgi:hypothetical protein